MFSLFIKSLLISLVLSAPPQQRIDKDTAIDQPPDKTVEEVKRPIHLEGLPLERDGDINKDFRQEILLGAKFTDGDGEDPKKLGELINAMFIESDSNGDGVLSPSELETRIVNNTMAHLAEGQQEADANFLTVDEDNDGSITWEEYQKHYKVAHENGEHGVLQGDDATELEHEKLTFMQADDDSDSVLSAKEWLGFLHPEHCKEALMDMALEIVKTYDKNGDGWVSKNEFAVAAPGEVEEQYKEMEEKETNRKLQEFETEIDANKDGKGTVSEFYEYVNPRNPQHARREVSEIMALADADNDGVLSLQELLDREWLLEGSALIDANRRLHEDL